MRCFPIVFIASQVFASASSAAFLRTEGTLMLELRTPDQDRLIGYLHANPKYFSVPVPTPLARSVVVDFLSAALKSPQPLETLRKLVRLAVFYDVREVAPEFDSLLAGHDREAGDTRRFALAIIALTWIGDDQQKLRAKNHFESLLKGFPDKSHRDRMLEACDALGPREGTQALRDWVARAIAQLNSNLERLRQQKQSDEAESSEDQIDELEEFIAVDLAAQDRTNTIRNSIDSRPSVDDVIPQIALLYIGDAPEATPPLSEWAGMKLVRLANPADNYRTRIAAQFVDISKRYQTAEEKQRAQAILFRTRALRAAEFFGQKLDSANSSWLAAQPDSGIDSLALRPNWKYPAGPAAKP
jgi:hypothetical protein